MKARFTWIDVVFVITGVLGWCALMAMIFVAARSQF